MIPIKEVEALLDAGDLVGAAVEYIRQFDHVTYKLRPCWIS